MKALIVDDEQPVRDAIRILVDWERHRIGEIFEAPEGETAIRIMESEKPEIVFTDMRMPVMGGVELLEWIHRRCPETRTIVISGHDDFDFVRYTVKYGGVDYILKPIDADELNQALDKAVHRWKRDQEARRQQQTRAIEINQIKPVYWEKLFSRLIQEAGIYAAFSEPFEREFNIAAKPAQGRIAVMRIDTMSRFVRDKFGANLDLLFFSLANVANEYLRQQQSGYAFRYWNSPHELVIVSWHSVDALEECIREINDGIRRTLGSRLDAGIGAVKRFPEGLAESYQEAQAVLKQRNLRHKPGRVLVYDANNIPRFIPLPFSRHESDFRAALLSGHDAQIKDAADRWMAAVQSHASISIEQLELWNYEYAAFKSRCLGECLSEGQPNVPLPAQETDALILPLGEDGTLSLPRLRDEITQDLLGFAALLAKLAQRERNIIREIAEYIERHYHEDLTLQHISDRFHMSREYISRRFKQEMHENITDYIVRIRIERAKQLLRTPQLRIVQIAEIIGYNDEKYFSKTFKKMVGQSPNEYRKNHAP